MKFHKIFLAIQSLVASVLLVSCEDKIDYASQVIGDGEAKIEATLEFLPSVTKLGGSRTNGGAISDIETLSLVVYNSDCSFNTLVNNV